MQNCNAFNKPLTTIISKPLFNINNTLESLSTIQNHEINSAVV